MQTYMYLVDYNYGYGTEYGGLTAVVARSTDRCFEILAEQLDADEREAHPEWAEQLRLCIGQGQMFALRDPLPEGIPASFRT